MLRLLLGAALFVCCGYAGYAVNAHYRKRSNLLDGIVGYIDALDKGISYLQSTLCELTKAYSSDKKGDCAAIFSAYVRLLEQGSFSKEDCMKTVATRLLTGYEKSVVADMLFSLGKSDYDTQLSDLAKFRAVLDPIAQTSKQNYKKYGGLSFKLGILAGLAALLIAA